jgi:hypothetical protein
MNKSVVTLLIVCGVLAGTTRQASAQGANLGGSRLYQRRWGVESGSSAMTDYQDRDDSTTRTRTNTSSEHFTSGSLFDVGVGIRIFKN